VPLRQRNDPRLHHLEPVEEPLEVGPGPQGQLRRATLLVISRGRRNGGFAQWNALDEGTYAGDQGAGMPAAVMLISVSFRHSAAAGLVMPGERRTRASVLGLT